MEKIIYTKAAELEALIARPSMDRESLDKIVRIIFDEVFRKGDAAINKYTYFYDGVTMSDLRVSQEEIDASEQLVDETLKAAMAIAKENIEKFHGAQLLQGSKVETTSGVTCWEKSVGIEKVGLYIPGGSAPLFSSVLMLAVPARLAGCREIVLCTPPQKDGLINPAILYAAKLAGVTKVFKAGGIQAIAGMTYGTESIPKVYKIFGPGNQYVTAAKMAAFSEGVAIDMPAGPSEVMMVADDSAIPSFVAADLLSQAEHGEDSQVILVSIAGAKLTEIEEELQKQLQSLPRKEIAQKALEKSRIVIAQNEQEVLTIINMYAPEHLILSVGNSDYLAQNVVNAGSVFIGNFTPESAGDYASGTNHTLPTNGFAKSYGGISVESFTKKIFFQEITRDGIQNLGKVIEVMAENEQLIGHKRGVSIRLEYLQR
ncbi:histidinol dehydrogenase [Alistipes sp. ZOR0009]|uniref:histidinol dehydrogenase n=1 Tax=Alistipes sp. ZOR0009 TaxID=1339253 RepID=UPI0006478F50|nr:histidinol dehydrogenase [Alistipes sp. ZOR0009]